MGGRVVFNRASSTMDCIICNRSESGARLKFSGTVAVPGEFDLHVMAEGNSRRSRIAWMNGREMGVEFVGQSANILNFTNAVRRGRN